MLNAHLRYAAIVLFAGVVGQAQAQQPMSFSSLKDGVPHIATVGIASADVVPDEATISIGVETERPSALAASADNAKAMEAVLNEVKSHGIEAKDIKTTSATLSMVYDDEYDQRNQRTKHDFRGYQASERLSILVRAVKTAGVLAQSLIAKGANEFFGIAFDYSKEREKKRALQAEAMRDALAEAQSYTGALGLKLGRVIQIGSDPGPGEGGLADLPSRSPNRNTVSLVAIPMEPGVQTISTSISVIWEITNP